MSDTDSDGRFLVQRDGQRHIRVMKGMVLTPRKFGLLVVGVIILFLMPDITNATPIPFRAFAQGLMFGIAAVGLNLLLRHIREVSFGHAAFFGTGAYTTGVLTTHYNIASAELLLISGVIAATLMAVAIGYLTLRHVGIYFALLTLAFGQLLYAIAFGVDFFGSADGIAVRPDNPERKVEIVGTVLSSDIYGILIYYITVVLVLLAMLVMYRLVNSPFGRALDAIGQDRTRAQFIGIPVKRYVWIAFIISGIYGGIGGSMFGLFQEYVRPGRTLFLFRSGEILFMAILGGFQTLLGPLVGGVVLTYLLQSVRFFSEFFNFYTGLVLVLVVYFFPQGIIGSLRSRRQIQRELRGVLTDPTTLADRVTGRLKQSSERLRHTFFGGP